jgi:hypothetical protein
VYGGLTGSYFTIGASASGPYTLSNQQPYGVASYSSNVNSVTTKPLPSDIMSHCYGNTSNCAAGDAIAQCVMTDCGGLSELGNPSFMGQFSKASPGGNDSGVPTYYPVPTDTFYSVTAATPTGTETIIFHAPNAAKFSEAAVPNSDEQLGVWDQATGWVVQLYHCCGGSQTLPAASGCGSTAATACSITNATATGRSAASSLYSSIDYGYFGSSLPAANQSNAPLAGVIREKELQNGLIPHALMITIDCENNVTSPVFPAIQNAGICGSGIYGPINTNRASSGTLLFLDYTPTQIASFGLPAWQATILTALATYGAYVSDTGGSNVGVELVSDEALESSEAWKYYNNSTGCSGSVCYTDPLWPWILAQKGLDGTLNLTHTGCTNGSGSNPSTYRCIGAFLANIPRTIGPEGSDSEGDSCTAGSGCYPSGHLHVADSCIAEGYAGVSGGCS